MSTRYSYEENHSLNKIEKIINFALNNHQRRNAVVLDPVPLLFSDSYESNEARNPVYKQARVWSPRAGPGPNSTERGLSIPGTQLSNLQRQETEHPYFILQRTMRYQRCLMRLGKECTAKRFEIDFYISLSKPHNTITAMLERYILEMQQKRMTNPLRLYYELKQSLPQVPHQLCNLINQFLPKEPTLSQICVSDSDRIREPGDVCEPGDVVFVEQAGSVVYSFTEYCQVNAVLIKCQDSSSGSRIILSNETGKVCAVLNVNGLGGWIGFSGLDITTKNITIEFEHFATETNSMIYQILFL